MAVTQTFSRVSYDGNGSNQEFSLSTKVFALTDVSVVVKNKTTGIVTPLVVTTNYTIAAISGNLDNGVTVTTVSTYTSNDQITLVRTIAKTQTLELEEGGDMPANELEDALDRGVMIGQQNADEGGRHIVAPATDASTVTYDLPTAELRASKAIVFAADGSVAVASIADSGGAFTAVETDTGLAAAGGIISGKVDDVTLAFATGTGGKDFAIKALGVGTAQLAANAVTTAKVTDQNITKAKIEAVTAQNVLGNTTLSASPVEVPIVGATGLLLDENTMVSDSALKGATQQSIKAYVDTYAVKYSGASVGPIAPSTSWQTLDISSTVGVARALVVLEVYDASTAINLLFRTNLGSIEPFNSASNAGWGASGGRVSTTDEGFIATLLTDASGVVQFIGSAAATAVNVKVLSYQLTQ